MITVPTTDRVDHFSQQLIDLFWASPDQLAWIGYLGKVDLGKMRISCQAGHQIVGASLLFDGCRGRLTVLPNLLMQ